MKRKYYRFTKEHMEKLTIITQNKDQYGFKTFVEVANLLKRCIKKGYKRIKRRNFKLPDLRGRVYKNASI